MITINEMNYYTTKDISKKFDVSHETIRRWRDSGLLRYKKISERKFIYSEIDLENMMKGK